MAEYAVHRHLNDRFGMLITQQDLTTTTWSKFDQDHPHVKDEIMAYIRAQAKYGYLLTNDKKLTERIRKKWGNAKAALERKANKAIADDHKTRAADSATQAALPPGPSQTVATGVPETTTATELEGSGGSGGHETG
ncbi:hypothetical protein ABBQ32_011733 [Trebouxia sp. C0010 RCD-2024]